METILLKEPYLNEISSFWRKTYIPIGIASAVLSMALIGLTGIGSLSEFADSESFHALLNHFIYLTIVGGLSIGTCIGIALPLTITLKMRSLMSLIYDDDPTVVNPPPSSRQWRVRLPCTWLKIGNFGIGGVLYIDGAGMAFVPHKKNLLKHQAVLEMSPLGPLKLSLIPKDPGWLERLVSKETRQLLQIQAPNGSYRFSVPEPHMIFQNLQRRVATLLTNQ